MDHVLKLDNTHEKDVLMSLTYISRHNEQNLCRELTRVLEQGLRSNEKNNITSALIINKKYVIQTIEGPKPKINQLVIKLINNHQYSSIEVVDTQEIEQRRWKGFAMKYVTPNTEDESCRHKHFLATADFNPYLMEKDKIIEFTNSIFEKTETRAHETIPDSV